MTRRRDFLWIGLICLMLSMAGCQVLQPPVEGASGVGDPYYPMLGNGGYDVEHYTIALTVEPLQNSINGSTTIEAQALQRLRSFNLDFHGLTIDSVEVNNNPAIFSREGDELTIEPTRSLAGGRDFTARISYHGTPDPVLSGAGIGRNGWFQDPDGTVNVISEPDGASSWFPVNDHPRDKATYRFEITVPIGWTVAATGYLRETIEVGNQTQFVWEMDRPMASYLASINVDQYIFETSTGPSGITIRNYFPPDYPAELKANYDELGEMIAYFSDFFGPYPFEAYGVVIADNLPICPVALEAQTLSVHCPAEVMATEYVIAHEIAHQWFGDSVSLYNWQDVWLKEGIASYAGWMWLQRETDLEQFSEYVRTRKDSFNLLNPIGAPPAGQLYGGEVYIGGAIFFHALRLQVGDQAFFELLRAYLERYRDGNATVSDLLSTAERVSGQQLDDFFASWLFAVELPDLPQGSE